MTSVADLLLKYSDYLNLSPNNRVLCSITNHEMPLNYEIILQHINSKKFKKHLEWYSKDYSIYEPFIITNKKRDNRKLFCTLTRQLINKIPEEVEKHVNGKRFQRLKAEYLEKKKANKANRTNTSVSLIESNVQDEVDFWMPEEEDINDDINENSSISSAFDDDTITKKRKLVVDVNYNNNSNDDDDDDNTVTIIATNKSKINKNKKSKIKKSDKISNNIKNKNNKK